MVERHQRQVRGAPDAKGEQGLPAGFIYRTVTEYIDPDTELSAVPVHDELIRSAELLSDPEIDSAGRSPVLYPKNESLSSRANVGALERRLAAWYYIDNRLRDEMMHDAALRAKLVYLGNLIARALIRSARESDRVTAEQIRKRVKELKSEQEGRP
jgi:hypothetical protein